MADRIERNDPAEFGGALLLVPPDGGDPVELLLIQPTRDLALFWSTVNSLVQIKAREFEEKARANDPFRR